MKRAKVSRTIALVTALILTLVIFVPSWVSPFAKAASAAEGTRLNFNESNGYTLTVGSGDLASYNTLPSGTYNVSNNGRVYTYDLEFSGDGSQLDGALISGDRLVFDPATKRITWTYDPAHRGYVNAETVADKTVDENGNITLSLKYGQNSKAAFVKETTYYCFDDSTNTYYIFTVKDDVIGYKNGDSTGGISDSLPYYYERTITDPELINSAENPVTISFNTTDGTVDISGNQLKRRQIYRKVNSFTDGKVYLIRALKGDKLLESGQSTTPRNGVNCENNGSTSNCNYTSSSTNGKHTYYNLSAISKAQKTYNGESLYRVNGNRLSESFNYYDGGETEDDLALSEYRAKQRNRDIEYDWSVWGGASIDNSVAYYLFGYDEAGNHADCFTSDKTLGKIFHRSDSYIKLFDLCEGSGRVRYGTGIDISSQSSNHNNYALWDVDGTYLRVKFRTMDSAGTLKTAYLGQNTADSFVLTENKTDSYEIYQRESVYKVIDYEGLDSTDTDKIVSREVTPRSVTYSETDPSENGLELKKTVTDNGDDTFSVQLEAWTTSEKLDLPETDIVLVLDTSKNMNNVLYKRDYENLNTYARFQKISLSDVSYNDFHDSANKHNEYALVNMSNDYADNKYIEDPNNPGMYVYVSSTYKLQASLSEPHLYKYSFTDNYGNVYVSDPEWKGVSLFGSLNAFGSVNSIKFKLKTRAVGSPADIKTEFTTYDMYTRTDSNTNYLNKNLYAESRDGGGAGLYYKHTDGQFYEVRVTRETDTFQASGIFNNQTVTQPVKYTYTLNIGNKTYTAVQGNQEYGADYGVFQGFRNYKYDNEGDLTLDISKENLLSKSLYVKTGTNATSVTAMQAMKESMEEFLLSSHYQSITKKSGVNIALFTYDKSVTKRFTLDKSQSNYTYVNKPVGEQSIDNMISAIYNYSVTDTEASELGDAMAAAYNEMNTYSPEGNRRFAALFTAGVPADYTTFWGFDTSSNTFDTSIADTAIDYANRLKNNLGTTVYSVGLFDNADENKVNGKYWYYAFLEKVPCSGRVGSYWGGSWLSNYGFSMDPKDAYATNRMLAYISSDYSNATSLGLTRGRYSPSYSGIIGYLFTRGYGYRIDRNFTRSDTGYYFGVSPKHFDEDAASEAASGTSLTSDEVNAILTNVFEELGAATAIPNSNLDASATLLDGITEYFQMVEGSEVTAYAADYATGTKVQNLTPVVSDDGKEVSVSGFNYSEHYVGSGSDQKVVVRFDITREDDFIGGNDIPTNQSKSGVYDGEDLLEETFDIPHADVDIKMNNIVMDDSVYYGSDEYLPDLLKTKWTNGTNNAFVDIVYTFKDAEGNTINTYTVPAGESVGTWERSIAADGTNAEYVNYPMLDTTEFTIDCQVIPTISGSVDQKAILDDHENPYQSTVYVFKPHFDVHNDTVNQVGDKYRLDTIPEQSWIAYDTDGAELTGSELTKAEGYLEEKVMPDFSYEIKKGDTTIITVTAELDDNGEYEYTVEPSDYDGTTIKDETDFAVANVLVEPTPFTYEIEDVVEINYYTVSGSGEEATASLLYSYDPQNDIYYDSAGQEADHDTAAAAVAYVSAENTEVIRGIVQKTINRSDVNASTNNDVTFLNTDDKRINGDFTISITGFDVTILNHTVKAQGASNDYADRTKEFPLTLTLTQNNVAQANKILDVIDEDGRTTTLTFDENGQAVIYLKNGESVTLKQVTNGAVINIASNPDDQYYVLYQVGETQQSLTPQEEDANEAIDVSISGTRIIDVTHSIEDILVTGSMDGNTSYIMLIVLLMLSGVAGYLVYRKYRKPY